MSQRQHQAELVLDGVRVGVVTVRGADAAWSWGDFEPAPSFSKFAPLFGLWSLLLHADDERDRQSQDAADELRQTERAIDLLKAELHWTEGGAQVKLEQLNIDGTLIEWKQR
jgi:hypothetical protein